MARAENLEDVLNGKHIKASSRGQGITADDQGKPLPDPREKGDMRPKDYRGEHRR